MVGEKWRGGVIEIRRALFFVSIALTLPLVHNLATLISSANRSSPRSFSTNDISLFTSRDTGRFNKFAQWEVDPGGKVLVSVVAHLLPSHWSDPVT